MTQGPEMTCMLELPGGLRCEVSMTVIGERVYPTPGEPDTRRAPLATEWTAILMKLMRMDFRLSTVTGQQSLVISKDAGALPLPLPLHQ